MIPPLHSDSYIKEVQDSKFRFLVYELVELGGLLIDQFMGSVFTGSGVQGLSVQG